MMKNEKPRRTKSAEPIPEFTSRDEEAAFWDTHELADYWDEMKPARVRYIRNLTEGITIRLDPATLQELRAQAHERGVGPTTLARMWILEHLRSTTRRVG